MEILGVIDVPMWMILFICAVFFLAYYSVQPFSVWKTYGIDGPQPVPFFGNVLQYYDARTNCHNRIDEWKRKYGSVFGMYQFRDPILVVTEPEMLKEILAKNFTTFPDRYVPWNMDLFYRQLEKAIIFAKGDNWRRIRHITAPTFTAAKIKSLTHHVNYTARQLSENFLKHANGRCTIDAKEFFSAFSLDTIAGIAFSFKMESQNDFDLPFVKNSKVMLRFNSKHKILMVIGGVFPPLMTLIHFLGIELLDSNVAQFFDKWLHSMIHERKSNSGKEKYTDFLNLFLEAECEDGGEFQGNKLTYEEIISQCILFFQAGYETTSTTLQYMFYELSRNKDVQDKIVAEIRDVVGDSENPTYEQVQNMKYTIAAINETLRMHHAISMITRRAVHTCTIGRYTIPAGAGIFIPSSNISRDPQLFEQPDEFRPERFLEGDASSPTNPIFQLWFGFGPRACIGKRLAMMNMQLALIHILRKVVIVKALPEYIEIEDYSTLTNTKDPILLAVDKRMN